MTTKRKDQHSTEFGLWIREIPELDSALGFLATNIDFLWTNYKTGEWMFLEEKRHMAEPKPWQAKLFVMLDKVAKSDPKYKGFHFVQFENTSPLDGRIFLDRKEVTSEQFRKFLKTFELPKVSPR